MCLIAFAWGASEQYPFVIAANRDEFLDRPTAPLALWQSPGGANVLSGRDLRDGGTWMGFSPQGRFAMLTNVRNPNAQPPEQAISRGGLALSWLESTLPAPAWRDTVQASRYQGFNLIVGDWQQKQCFYLSNQTLFTPFQPPAPTESTEHAPEFIAHEIRWGQVTGLSNAALSTPWPKTQALQTALAQALHAKDEASLRDQALQALASRAHAPDDLLPRTGVALELERALSSAFVCHPADAPRYGTRTSLVAVFSASQGLRVTEVTHAQGEQATHTAQAELGWR